MLDAASQIVLRVPKATLDILGAYGEALFRVIFGLELDGGKAWRRKSLGTGVYQPEDPWEVRERLLVYQPEDPWPEDSWEVRERLMVHQPEDPSERLFRGFRGVSVTAGGLKRGRRVESGRKGVLDAASQTCFTGPESNVRHAGGVRGGPL